MLTRFILTVALFLAGLVPPSFAGLYYSGEVVSELPVQWRGFLLDHRALRLISVPASDRQPATLLREQYQQAAKSLEDKAKHEPLTTTESADLGAIYVRLGQPDRAVESLRMAQRRYPKDFKIAANLGTAWQQAGNLSEAVSSLQEAVKLAPKELKRFEEMHLRLVRDRLRQGKNPDRLDSLFEADFSDRKSLPMDDVAIVQRLALWLPADGKLLWQLGELANAHGDVRTAASILDGCVGEFGLSFPEIRKRRQTFREKADEIAKLPDEEHAKFKGDIKFNSPRALVKKLDPALLPPVQKDRINTLPWLVINEVTIGKKAKPNFPKYLEDLNELKVSITGYMQPMGDDPVMNQFLFVEFPIGCWFCDTPDPTNIFRVQLPEGKVMTLERKVLKLEGVLKLNRTDPEDFLYTIRDAKLKDPD